jgi:long-chain acyl-CoA synthetase
VSSVIPGPRQADTLSEKNVEERTIYQVLRDTVARHGSRPALGRKVGPDYAYITYDELWGRVRQFRRGLAALGLSRGDRVAILSENRPEWAITDLAAQCMGAVTVPIYSTLPAAQVRYLVADSAARVIVVSDKKQLAKVREIVQDIRTLEHVVVMDDLPGDDVLTFEQVVAKSKGSESEDATLDAAVESASPEEMGTLIYTSGTTGEPKGAMLSQRALLHTAWAARQVVELDENDLFLSFLPLCHVIERVGGHYLPLSMGACIVYSEGVFTIAQELAKVQPSVFLCVPRLYENMHDKLLEALSKAPPRRKRLAEWALRVGDAWASRKRDGRSPGIWLGAQRAIADRLVLSKIRAKSVGNRTRFFVSGGAPLSPTTGAFFESLGVTIVEGYGLTEIPVICLNRPERPHLGTVGPALPELEVRIAEDGEILGRGPSLMRGYFGKPQATAEAIDTDGWFHTGDVGELLPDGCVRITDRKKDIIVLANGKNVAPQPIEAQLKQSPYIAEAVLIGDKQASIVAIFVPAFDKLKSWAKQRELPASDMQALLRHAETRKLFKDEIDSLSRELADFEKVKRFSLVDQPFSIEGGELTPTLKVKRRVVAEKYSSLIEQMAK